MVINMSELFTVDGTVKFERVGRDRKKVSVYAAQ